MHSEDELRRFGAWERQSWEQTASAYAASLGVLTRGSIPALLEAAGVRPGTPDQSFAMVQIATARAYERSRLVPSRCRSGMAGSVRLSAAIC